MMDLTSGLAWQISCIARPSSKPGRIHGTYAISPPKISCVSFSQFLLAAMAMIAFGCMWSTNFAGMKLCKGVSIELARGFKLKVVWL